LPKAPAALARSQQNLQAHKVLILKRVHELAAGGAQYCLLVGLHGQRRVALLRALNLVPDVEGLV